MTTLERTALSLAAIVGLWLVGMSIYALVGP